MKFTEVAVADAVGVVLAHSVRIGSGTLKKGRRLVEGDIAILRNAGLDHVTAAILEPGDLGEDDAAADIGRALCGAHIAVSRASSGRCNLVAKRRGFISYSATRLSRLNMMCQAVKVIARRDGQEVGQGELIAQVKVIPYAVDAATMAQVLHYVGDSSPLVSISPARDVACGLLQTRSPGTREPVLDKTREVLSVKLAGWHATLVKELRCGHDAASIATGIKSLQAAGADMILIVGASSTTDHQDVVPVGIQINGGTIVQLGVPVEPGTLLGLAYTDRQVPVLILPGTARSPVASSLDMIAPALLHGRRLDRADLNALGSGGLLVAGSRSRRSDATRQTRGKVGAVVVAAGMSNRYGDQNKLLVKFGSATVLQHVIDVVAAASLDQIVVVLGYDAPALRKLIQTDRVTVVENGEYAEGLSSSLRRGIAALKPDVDAALVFLADMPWVTVADVQKLITAFADTTDASILVPVHAGRRGNPVLWPSGYFAALKLLRGDRGAQRLLHAYDDAVVEIMVEHDGILRDIDTPADITGAR